MRWAGVLLLLVFSGIGAYGAGYTQGRTDLEGRAQFEATVRAMIEEAERSIAQYDASKPWLQWDETIAESNKHIDLANEIIDKAAAAESLTPETLGLYDDAAAAVDDAVTVLLAGSAPPGGEWYRDGLIANHRGMARVWRELRGAAAAEDFARINDLAEEENTLIEDHLALTKRYQEWLSTQRP